jgi:hypothetical protein
MIDLGIEEGCLHWDSDGQFLADALAISQPTNILEIGYFSGGSAAMMLHLSDATLTSVDPMVNLYDANVKHDGSIESIDRLKKGFPNRFNFIQKDSKLVRPDLEGQQFDLIFIDGDHRPIGIRSDFNLALKLNIPWVLVDDFVTSVLDVYSNEFRDKFLPPVRVYPRKDLFQGQPIPIVLLRQRDKQIDQRYHG